jgi:hypothetical protein
MKKLTIITLSLLFISAYSQHNDTQAALYNIGFGGITGGIGAVINKQSGEKSGKVFLKDFIKGHWGEVYFLQVKKWCIILLKTII